jgi:hypothetical protein
VLFVREEIVAKLVYVSNVPEDNDGQAEEDWIATVKLIGKQQ